VRKIRGKSNCGGKSTSQGNPYFGEKTKMDATTYTKYNIAGLSKLFCGAGNFDKIWPACWQHEFQYTE